MTIPRTDLHGDIDRLLRIMNEDGEWHRPGDYASRLHLPRDAISPLLNVLVAYGLANVRDWDGCATLEYRIRRRSSR